ncbi:hypothetical protein G6F46_012453 [Rhizopus delemar]|nr:hypothetical protein G6F52_005132 [Rhizopus delemar]KAG1538643.1 hypothetical protein G6F49_012535 [Rhizopus delemar]KAG1577675.1 hypothetical protein G6F48_012516 [Rhizopus delemar]KAG1590768.1 hypothetical protein G6F47_009944 [Rhizopus delemar]KAG1607222.1 hypothetical protein G6F46_012453 [Rhizopus delemar]
MSQILSIKALNGTDFKTFIENVNILFETAPPLANRLYERRPYSSYDALIEEAQEICFSSELSKQERIEIINAHPRIGESKANLSAMSQKEQGKGGEDQEVNEELGVLNEAYEAKYGFKFIVFVNGRSRREIIPVLKERMTRNTKEEELKIGIESMMQIAKDRLKKLIFIGNNNRL